MPKTYTTLEAFTLLQKNDETIKLHKQGWPKDKYAYSSISGAILWATEGRPCINDILSITDLLSGTWEDYIPEAPKKWVPKKREAYWRVDIYGVADYLYWCGNAEDYNYLHGNNVFPTAVASQPRSDYQNSLNAIRKYIYENGMGKEFVAGEKNFLVQKIGDEIEVDYRYSNDTMPLLGCFTKEHVEKLIKDMQKDLQVVFNFKK